MRRRYRKKCFNDPASGRCCRNANIMWRRSFTDCCGSLPYHRRWSMCCGGKLRRKTTGNSACCGSQVYNWQESICCAGRVESARSHLCCNGNLQLKPIRSPACCGARAYDSQECICCGGKVLSRLIFVCRRGRPQPIRTGPPATRRPDTGGEIPL